MNSAAEKAAISLANARTLNSHGDTFILIQPPSPPRISVQSSAASAEPLSTVSKTNESYEHQSSYISPDDPIWTDTLDPNPLIEAAYLKNPLRQVMIYVPNYLRNSYSTALADTVHQSIILAPLGQSRYTDLTEVATYLRQTGSHLLGVLVVTDQHHAIKR